MAETMSTDAMDLDPSPLDALIQATRTFISDCVNFTDDLHRQMREKVVVIRNALEESSQSVETTAHRQLRDLHGRLDEMLNEYGNGPQRVQRVMEKAETALGKVLYTLYLGGLDRALAPWLGVEATIQWTEEESSLSFLDVYRMASFQMVRRALSTTTGETRSRFVLDLDVAAARREYKQVGSASSQDLSLLFPAWPQIATDALSWGTQLQRCQITWDIHRVPWFVDEAIAAQFRAITNANPTRAATAQATTPAEQDTDQQESKEQGITEPEITGQHSSPLGERHAAPIPSADLGPDPTTVASPHASDRSQDTVVASSPPVVSQEDSTKAPEIVRESEHPPIAAEDQGHTATAVTTVPAEQDATTTAPGVSHEPHVTSAQATTIPDEEPAAMAASTRKSPLDLPPVPSHHLLTEAIEFMVAQVGAKFGASRMPHPLRLTGEVNINASSLSQHIWCPWIPSEGTKHGWLNDDIVVGSLRKYAQNYANVYTIEPTLLADWIRATKAKSTQIDHAPPGIPSWARKILLPFYKPDHWTLGWVDLDRNIIVEFDSMNENKVSHETEHVQRTRKLLACNRIDHSLLRVPGEDQTQFQIPHQQNGNDCGVWVASHGRCLIERGHPQEARSSVKLRHKLLWDIYNAVRTFDEDHPAPNRQDQLTILQSNRQAKYNFIADQLSDAGYRDQLDKVWHRPPFLDIPTDIKATMLEDFPDIERVVQSWADKPQLPFPQPQQN